MRVFLFCCTLIILFYCDQPTKWNDEINKDIVLIKDMPFMHMAVWRNNKLFSIKIPNEMTLNDEYAVESDSVYEFLKDTTITSGYNYKFIEANEQGTKVLYAKSIYRDVSAGSLYELDLESKEYTLLIESSYNVSSAVYWHGDDSRLVYYRYGNPIGHNPGYYLYDKNTKQSELLFEHIAPCGPSEMLNGFDLHPNNNVLLIPAVQAPPLSNKSPKIIKYNINKKTIDTLSVNFDLSNRRIGLWLRYNSDASRILYCNFPRGSFTSTTNDDSEVGIIELPSQDRKILDVNTNSKDTYKSVQIAPNWSPDYKHIVYGSGPLSIEGARGRYSLYILKNVN
jgi:hypothetical protein